MNNIQLNINRGSGISRVLVLGPDLHVDPKGPDVQGVDGFPEPGGQIQSIQTAPGPRDQAGWEGAVQRHLQEEAETAALHSSLRNRGRFISALTSVVGPVLVLEAKRTDYLTY